MNGTNAVGWTLACTLAACGTALGAEQDNAALAEIASLRAEIASLRSDPVDHWLTDQRAAEIRSLVTDVLADASARTSLQGSSAASGYNGGFFLSSADGNYSMTLNVLEQIRWTYDHRSGGFPSGGPDGNANNWGFENKRTRLSWSGHVVDSTWSYKLAYYFAYSNDVEFDYESTVLADAWAAKDLGNGLTLTVGQFKLPFSGEYGLDAGTLQFNDYSTVSNQFSTGYGQGVMLGYAADAFHASAAYVNELASTNDAFSSESPSTDIALAGRGELKLHGDWAQFNSAQSFKGESLGVLVGGGLAWEDARGADVELFTATADVTVDFGGANLFGAFYWENFEFFGESASPYGFTIQGGVFVCDTCEVVARFEYGSMDDGSDGEFSALTLGANWYFAQNAAKFGTNFGYAFDGVSDEWLGAGLGNNWQQDEADEDGQWMLQAQLSFSF